MIKKSLVSVPLLFVLVVIPALAQTDEARHLYSELAPQASTNCDAGIKYDDGSFNDAYSMGSGSTPNGAMMVMKFDLPAGTTSLDQVCAAFSRLSTSSPSSASFDVVVYND